MIKDRIDKVVGIADKNAFLPGLKTEAVPQFQEKFLQFVEQLIFQVRFAHNFFGFQAEKFEDVRISDGKGRSGGFGSGLGEFLEFFLVFGKTGAFVIEAVDLTFEFPDRPVSPNALDFV